jgi:hypothetical protein
MAISEATHSPSSSATVGHPASYDLRIASEDADALKSTLTGLLHSDGLDLPAKVAVLSAVCQLTRALRS